MADSRPEFLHVADLCAIQRDRNSEIRLRLMESWKGFAVEVRKFQRSAHHEGMNAGGPGLFVHVDRIPELIAGLEKARMAASALREAARA
jgi:hypothetical protein